MDQLSPTDLARVRIQEELKSKLVTVDTESWPADLTTCRYIAGLDVSYEKDSTRACAAIVIFDTSEWTTVYSDLKWGHVTTDYAAGFLAFREIDFLVDLVRKFRESAEYPKYDPQVWLVDGNGLMHPRGLGLASHFGVIIDRPTIGVSKNPYFFSDGPPANRESYKAELEVKLQKRGDMIEIAGADGSTVVGVALKTQDSVKNPVYVSIGHRVSLETAVAVTLKCCREFKNPEPLRQADMVSREALRKNEES